MPQHRACRMTIAQIERMLYVKVIDAANDRTRDAVRFPRRPWPQRAARPSSEKPPAPPKRHLPPRQSGRPQASAADRGRRRDRRRAPPPPVAAA